VKFKINVLYFIILFYFLPAALLPAETISGTIITENESPVADATIVLLELDLIVISDVEGFFQFEDLDKGYYTILIIAPGYVELEKNISAPFSNIIISLSPELIEMEEIIVYAETDDPIEIVNEGVTTEELERLPTRADPFASLSQEAGILTEINTGFRGMGRERSASQSGPAGMFGRFSIGQSNEITVYGGNSDWNNYYYDYIRLPTNTHTFGYPDPDAVVPVESIDSIDVHKGVVPVEYGPGIGGTFIMNPQNKPDKFKLTVTPSIMDISAHSSFNMSENINILLSANQSILNYTILPIITNLNASTSEDEPQLVEGDTPTSISYGDLLLKIAYTPPNNYLSFDFLGFYDAWAFDISIENTSDDIAGEIANLNSEYGPYYIAGGFKWIHSSNSNFSNSLYTFASIYRDTGDFNLHFPRDAVIIDEIEISPPSIIDYNTNWYSVVNSLQAGDEIQWDFMPDITLLWGINGRISELSGINEESNHEETPTGIIIDGSDPYNISFEDFLLSAYTYGKIIGKLPEFNYQIGSGLLWFPTTGTVRPAFDGEFIYSVNSWLFALSAGWSPGVIDEFTYIDRRLDEIYYELDTATSADTPPMAAAVSGLINYRIDKDSSIKISPYFSRYYDLSGISMSTSYTDLDDNFVSLDPSSGYSIGFDLGWSTSINEYMDWDISYAYSLTRYKTELLGWIPPNTEVSHALKSSALIRIGGFSGGLNFLTYSGIPFTPEIVDSISVDEPIIISGDYNSATDYVPLYEFTTNLLYKWDLKNLDLSIFINSSNWIESLNFVMSGLNADSETVIGATTADFKSREYSFSYTFTDFLISLLMSEIGLSLSY
jgi:hypothetical protein